MTRNAGPARASGLDFGFVRGWFVRYWLALWFAIVSGIVLMLSLQRSGMLFFDAQLYLDATRAWLAGGNPWDVAIADFYFAAPPPTLLPLVPFALLPAGAGVLALSALILAASVASVRMLRLPWWWLLFPPLVECVLSGNVQGLLLPLLLGGGGWLAVSLKVYAAVPLLILGRWRQLAGAAALIIVTAPLLPWRLFLDDALGIMGRLAGQTRYALPTPVLLALAPIGLVALVLVGRERAAWLAVPALWPSPQPYYASLVMPVRSQLVAALVAVPVSGSGLLALVVFATVIAIQRRSAGRAPRPAAPTLDGDLGS